MSERIFDQTVFIADSNSKPTTSSDYHSLSIDGDTIRICNERAVTLSSTGNVGEICWRKVTILGIDSWYICVCTAPNTWRGTSLSNLPI